MSSEFVAPVPIAVETHGEVLPYLAKSLADLREELYLELGVRFPPIVAREGRSRIIFNDVVVISGSAAARANVVTVRLGEVLRVNARMFVTLQAVQRLLDSVALEAPATVREIVPQVVSLRVLTEVLGRLVDEGVSIRNLPEILQAIGETSEPMMKASRLVEKVRQRIGATIVHGMLENERDLRVFLLDPALEDIVRERVRKLQSGDEYLGLRAEEGEAFIEALKDELARLEANARVPVILTTEDIRPHVRRYLQQREDFSAAIDVVSFQELPRSVHLKPGRFQTVIAPGAKALGFSARRSGMPSRLPIEKRNEAKRLYASGMTGGQVAAIVGCHPNFVFNLHRRSPWPVRKRIDLRLSLAEREEISRGLESGESLRSIARRLGRAPSTVSREVGAQGAHRYRAWRGEERAEKLMARPKLGKLEASSKLVNAIEAGLLKGWSPAQIARRLRVEHPDDESMRVSHETIYQALYVQGRGSLRKELTQHLRRGRTQRRPRGRKESPRGIKGMLNISQRPPEAADRAVPGHWEGDLIIGKGSQSAIGTLVERTTRYVMLLHLPDGRSATQVCDALTRKILQLPLELRRSLTWDQGVELAEHARFTVETGVKVYFCDPHSPWQRGSNENTNGLLRQYLPKGTDLSGHSARELDRIARQLNGRPRETLGWRTPAEKLDELLGGSRLNAA